MQHKKVLLIWDRMGDYHRARWRALRDELGDPYVIAADLGHNDQLYQWDKTVDDYHFPLSKKPVEKSDLIRRVYNFINLIRRFKIEVIAQSGYGRLEYLLFIILSKFMRKRLILFAESWYPGNLIVDRLKGIFLHLFVDYFFVSGTKAKDHFKNRLHIPEAKIFIGYSAVDNRHFSKNNKISFDNLPVTGNKIDPSLLKPYLLCVARYSQEKNLESLINGFKLSFAFKKWMLVLIGDGPIRDELNQAIDKESENIKLIDWQDYNSLPTWYKNAEGLILPSIFEPWGLVVNEAMACGISVILSQECGCQPDLIPTPKHMVFDANDLNSIVQGINQLFSLSVKERRDLGNQNRNIISNFSVDIWAKKMVTMITSQ